MSVEMSVLVAVLGLYVLTTVVMVALMLRGVRRVPPGQALVVVPYSRTPRVQFAGGALVLPRLHQAYTVDLTQREFAVERRGRGGLVCKDGTRFEVKLVVRVRLARTQEDVLAAFEQLGPDKAADPATPESLFRAPVEEALRAALGEFDHEAALRRTEELRERVLERIEARSGFSVVECVLEDIRPVPAGQLDPNDVFDAQTLARLARARQAALN